MVDEVFGFELDRLGRKVRVWESRLAYLVKVIYFFGFVAFPSFSVLGCLFRLILMCSLSTCTIK